MVPIVTLDALKNKRKRGALKRKRAPQDEDADYKPEREQDDDQGEVLRPKGQRGSTKRNERLAIQQKRAEYFMIKASDKREVAANPEHAELDMGDESALAGDGPARKKVKLSNEATKKGVNVNKSIENKKSVGLAKRMSRTAALGVEGNQHDELCQCTTCASQNAGEERIKVDVESSRASRTVEKRWASYRKGQRLG